MTDTVKTGLNYCMAIVDGGFSRSRCLTMLANGRCMLLPATYLRLTHRARTGRCAQGGDHAWACRCCHHPTAVCPQDMARGELSKCRGGFPGHDADAMAIGATMALDERAACHSRPLYHRPDGVISEEVLTPPWAACERSFVRSKPISMSAPPRMAPAGWQPASPPSSQALIVGKVGSAGRWIRQVCLDTPERSTSPGAH